MHALPAPNFEVTATDARRHAYQFADRDEQKSNCQLGGHKSDDHWNFQSILAESQPGLAQLSLTIEAGDEASYNELNNLVKFLIWRNFWLKFAKVKLF